VNSGDTVAIKINLCDFRMPDTGAVTHPVFLDATLSFLRSRFQRLKIFVVESDATASRPDLLVHWLGLGPMIEKHNAKWVNLTREEVVEKRINGRAFQVMKIPKIIADCDYMITMPKLKTHLLTKMTCCMKNQFGCIPIPRKVRFHPNLDDVIVDACLAMKPDFCIVDGVLGLGGVKGPSFGVPIRSNVVITGRDPVSVDTVCAKVMGINPHLVSHLRKARESGIGQMAHKLVGEDLAAVRMDFEYNSLYRHVLEFAHLLKARAE